MTEKAPERYDCPRCKQDENYGCGCTSLEMADYWADRALSLEAQLAAAREVRLLEWVDTPKGRMFADILWGRYIIGTHEENTYWAMHLSGTTGYHFNFVADEVEAKAAAQADFQSRYDAMSALSEQEAG